MKPATKTTVVDGKLLQGYIRFFWQMDRKDFLLFWIDLGLFSLNVTDVFACLRTKNVPDPTLKLPINYWWSKICFTYIFSIKFSPIFFRLKKFFLSFKNVRYTTEHSVLVFFFHFFQEGKWNVKSVSKLCLCYLFIIFIRFPQYITSCLLEVIFTNFLCCIYILSFTTFACFLVSLWKSEGLLILMKLWLPLRF